MRSNDDPLRASYEVAPTPAFPYRPFGVPYPKVPPKLLTPSANEPPPATCIRPLEKEGMPTQVCAAALVVSKVKGRANERRRMRRIGVSPEVWVVPVRPDRVHPRPAA